MMHHIKRISVLLLAVGFAASPFLSNGFGGFDRASFPVQVDRWPAQPAGWAFSIWGLIYFALILSAAMAVLRPASAQSGWDRAALPLGVSLFLGGFWIEAAYRCPLLATAMILPMTAAAIVAMRLAGQDWREWAPLGLYSGWLTAASGVAVSAVLTGFGIVAPRPAAVACILLVLVVALWVTARSQKIWTYPAGVAWALFGIIAANAPAGDWLFVALGLIGIFLLAIPGVLAWRQKRPT